MRIIEIKALSNGAHRNQGERHYECPITYGILPEGWAVVPDDMETPNYPFGNVEVEEIDGVMTVTKWIAGTVPEQKKIEPPISEVEQLRADIDFLALMMEVKL